MKKTIFVFFSLMIFVGILVVNGCKTEETFDIRGIWNISLLPSGMSFIVTFSGSEDSGDVVDTYSFCPGAGTYTVNDSQVSWTSYYPCGPLNVTFTGTNTGENNMSGTWIDTLNPGDTGSWQATR